MATQAATVDRQVSAGGGAIAITWGAMANGDTGAPIKFAEFSDKTFHATGTFGAAGNVLIEGSNDGTNFFALSNRQGTAMNLTAAAPMNTSQDRPIWVRPRATAGDGTTAVVVIAACHRSDIAVVG